MAGNDLRQVNMLICQGVTTFETIFGLAHGNFISGAAKGHETGGGDTGARASRQASPPLAEV